MDSESKQFQGTGGFMECPPYNQPKIEKCQGLIGMLFGHSFVATANFKSSPGNPFEITEQMVLGTVGEIAEIIEAGRNREETYRGHVCVRCGLVVNRQ